MKILNLTIILFLEKIPDNIFDIENKQNAIFTLLSLCLDNLQNIEISYKETFKCSNKNCLISDKETTQNISQPLFLSIENLNHPLNIDDVINEFNGKCECKRSKS